MIQVKVKMRSISWWFPSAVFQEVLGGTFLEHPVLTQLDFFGAEDCLLPILWTSPRGPNYLATEI